MTCFNLNLYWVNGDKSTKAEAMLKFMLAGARWSEAERRFSSCALVLPAEDRKLPEDWWFEAIGRETEAKLLACALARTPSSLD